MAEVDWELMNWLCDKLKHGQDETAVTLGKEPAYDAGYGGNVDGHEVGEDGILMQCDDGRRVLLRVEEVWTEDEW